MYIFCPEHCCLWVAVSMDAVLHRQLHPPGLTWNEHCATAGRAFSASQATRVLIFLEEENTGQIILSVSRVFNVVEKKG